MGALWRCVRLYTSNFTTPAPSFAYATPCLCSRISSSVRFSIGGSGMKTPISDILSISMRSTSCSRCSHRKICVRCFRLIMKPFGSASSLTNDTARMSLNRYSDRTRPVPGSICMSLPPPTPNRTSRIRLFRVYFWPGYLRGSSSFALKHAMATSLSSAARSSHRYTFSAVLPLAVVTVSAI